MPAAPSVSLLKRSRLGERCGRSWKGDRAPASNRVRIQLHIEMIIWRKNMVHRVLGNQLQLPCPYSKSGVMVWAAKKLPKKLQRKSHRQLAQMLLLAWRMVEKSKLSFLLRPKKFCLFLFYRAGSLFLTWSVRACRRCCCTPTPSLAFSVCFFPAPLACGYAGCTARGAVAELSSWCAGCLYLGSWF